MARRRNLYTSIPARRAIVFGVDQESDAPDLLSDAEAAIGRAKRTRRRFGERPIQEFFNTIAR